MPARNPIRPLINTISGRFFKNDEMQGARILENKTYIQHAAMMKDGSQAKGVEYFSK